jgi:hypothetical protein
LRLVCAVADAAAAVQQQRLKMQQQRVKMQQQRASRAWGKRKLLVGTMQ